MVTPLNIFIEYTPLYHLNPQDQKIYDYTVNSFSAILVIADFMYKNKTEKANLTKRFTTEGRKDMLEEMEEENFTDIEWLTGIIKRYGRKIYTQQGSTISWIVKAA